MSRLIDFYRGTTTDSEGRLLSDILAWPDDELEAVHDFIQWVFPLPEPSQFNRNAPLLTREDIAAFQSDVLLRANLKKSFDRILVFLGLTWSETGEVVEGPNFAARGSDVWAVPNHNWLRISRILRSLTLLGSADLAQALYRWLESAYQKNRFPIPANTFRYWTDAVAGGVLPRA